MKLILKPQVLVILLALSFCVTDNANLEDNLNEMELKIVSTKAKTIGIIPMFFIKKNSC